VSRLSAGQAVLARQALGDGVIATFSGRGGGVSTGPYESLNLGLRVGDDAAAVAANRAALAEACGVAAGDLAWMSQVHGADVCYLGAGIAEPPGPVDAMFTDVPGRPLCVQVADCVPVLVADPVARLVGAAHAGREGMVAGVVLALITAMTAAGASPARMRALTGPSICGGCYEVPAEMQARASAVVPDSRCQTYDGTPGLDIAAGVRAQLAASGVGWFRSVPRCTRESDDLFSYRRDGTTGRSAGVIWLAA
jgi:purine-nucleoside/S-methyl-5'-thioadenosine phosphorylase / adenosine deaminase